MVKCVICNKRPSNGKGLCHNCEAQCEKDKRSRKPEKPYRFVTYRGHVVGLFPSGEGTYRPRLMTRNPDRLPKGITINLNQFCEGYDKATIKRLKAAVLSCAGA